LPELLELPAEPEARALSLQAAAISGVPPRHEVPELPVIAKTRAPSRPKPPQPGPERRHALSCLSQPWLERRHTPRSVALARAPRATLCSRGLRADAPLASAAFSGVLSCPDLHGQCWSAVIPKEPAPALASAPTRRRSHGLGKPLPPPPLLERRLPPRASGVFTARPAQPRPLPERRRVRYNRGLYRSAVVPNRHGLRQITIVAQASGAFTGAPSHRELPAAAMDRTFSRPNPHGHR
jgi:hypothetical protein